MSVSFESIIEKFDKKGEKTSWTYISIDEVYANKINPKVKSIYRVKGTIDNLNIKSVAIMPMGDSTFILPLNQAMRKVINKKLGETVQVALEIDTSKITISQDLLDCIDIEPRAKEFFDTLTNSHQNYFSKWVDSAKTAPTKEKRLHIIIEALIQKKDYGTMLRSLKA